VPLEDDIRLIVREEIRAALSELGSKKESPALLNSKKLCAALGISRGTLRVMMAEGVPHSCPGTYPRFDLDDVRRFMREKRRGTKLG
jgi:hypothetical protein